MRHGKGVSRVDARRSGTWLRRLGGAGMLAALATGTGILMSAAELSACSCAFASREVLIENGSLLPANAVGVPVWLGFPASAQRAGKRGAFRLFESSNGSPPRAVPFEIEPPRSCSIAVSGSSGQATSSSVPAERVSF